MRHRNAGKQLGRNSSHRRALLRNMVTSLFKYEQIETTDAKAKAIRPVAEKMITLAKRGDLHSRRQALAYIEDKKITHKLFEELKERYLDRQGGYLRVVKKGFRKGDGSPVSIVQLLPVEEGKKKRKRKAKSPKPTKAAGKKPKKPETYKKDKEKPKKKQDKIPSDMMSDDSGGKKDKE
jgi:large subunit ribosomal protein L17